LLAGGAIAGGLAKAADDDFVSACPSLRDCDPRLRGAREDAIERARLSNVLLLSGTVAVAGGVVWFLVAPPPSPPVAGSRTLVGVTGSF
jgi:hypothetical protein